MALTITPFLNRVNDIVINPLILLVFAVAFLSFFFGLFQFIQSSSEGEARELGKRRIAYGLIGMLIMFSVYGIIRVVLGTFGISPPSNIVP